MGRLYDILNLEPSASSEDIVAALTEQRRVWRRRVNSPEIGARQEAERRMHELDDAERVLLDVDKRLEYDATHSTTPEAGGAAIVQALHQIERGQHGAAIFTAKRAVEEDPDNAYAYSVLAEAAITGGDDWLAGDAIDKALRIEPEDARLHAQRAAILAATGDTGRAVASLRTAISLDSAEPEYFARLVHYLVDGEEIDSAVSEGEQAYRAHPEDADVKVALATALAERAVLAQHELPDGRLVITSAAQASHVEALADRGLSIDPPDAEVGTELRRLRGYARKARRRTFSFGAFRRRYKWSVGLGFLAGAAVCCLPNLDSADASTRALGSLMSVGVIIAFVVTFAITAFEPQYVRNAALIEHAVPRRMGRGPASANPNAPAPKYAAVRPRSASDQPSASKRHREQRRSGQS